MKLEKILPVVSNIPHMSRKQGTILYNMILDKEIDSILELGTAHGTGSCYMAAALHEKGGGSVLTIDNKKALDREPNAKELIRKCHLEDYATPLYANTSYNWELMKIIERQTKDGICEPVFDFCYLDGAHNFEIDCCAFFLVDKLLKPGGYILFDDLNWTYANSPSLKDTDWVRHMEEDEKTTPHIKKLIELMVTPHDNYSDFDYLNDWCLVKKKEVKKGRRKSFTLKNYESSTRNSIYNKFKGYFRR